MKIYFAVIENISDARQKADVLMAQLTNGNMGEARKLEQELLSSAGPEISGVWLSEDEWKQFLKIVRESHPDFQADIVLDRDSIVRLNEIINALPQCIHEIIRLAFDKNCGILELPMEDEEDE